MAWFTYRCFSSGQTFAGVSLTNRIKDKIDGLAYLVGPPPEVIVGDPNQLDKLTFSGSYVVFSEQDIPQIDFPKVKWDGNDLAYVSQSQQDTIDAFIASAKQMWIDRKSAINQLMADIVTETNWSNLTEQHKKVLLGATVKDFSETDWDTLGLNDENYVGDFDYDYSQWNQFGIWLGLV